MSKTFTMGSLFDGSGGFPFAAALCGIKPVWASEIEEFPIKVSSKHFPMMKHLGSVTDVKGDEIEPVDIISFGSPCQDLSVAGKRKSFFDENGEMTRSGLFYEAVRIIKEMRDADRFRQYQMGKTDDNIRLHPRFALWENVPGAFSSNKGQDFRCVLEELAKVKDNGANIPMPDGEKWHYSGCIMGDSWSIAYRTFDAQFWGVPQRRRRIYLVADFDGQRAGEILFERKGSLRNFAEGKEERERIASDLEKGIGTWSED